MLTAADLTPHLAAAMPRLAAVVPWLMIWGVAVIGLALVGSVFIVRRAASPAAGDGSVFVDTARRLRRGRRGVLIALAGAVGFWALTWLAGGPDPVLTELVFAVLVAGCLGPLYVAMRVFSGAMTRAAARARGARPPAPSPPRGEGRDGRV